MIEVFSVQTAKEMISFSEFFLKFARVLDESSCEEEERIVKSEFFFEGRN